MLSQVCNRGVNRFQVDEESIQPQWQVKEKTKLVFDRSSRSYVGGTGIPFIAKLAPKALPSLSAIGVISAGFAVNVLLGHYILQNTYGEEMHARGFANNFMMEVTVDFIAGVPFSLLGSAAAVTAYGLGICGKEELLNLYTSFQEWKNRQREVFELESIKEC